jgi:hypothetical protein
MICSTLKKFKSRHTRNVYFKLERYNELSSIKLETRSTILNNITSNDELVTLVNLPVEEKGFYMESSVYFHEPVTVNRYSPHRKYSLTNGAIFDLFDRVNVRKDFLYDVDEMRRLIRVFCSCGSFEGIVWMHNSLVKHEKINPHKGSPGVYVHGLYRHEGPSSSEFLKNLEQASTWHHKFLTQLLKNKE